MIPKGALLTFRRELLKQALPGFLVLAKTSLEIVEDAIEVCVGAQIVSRRIFLEAWVVFVAEVDSAA